MKPRVDPTLTTRRFAETVGASESSVKRWIDRGEIGAFRTGGGHRRVPLVEAIKFIRRTSAPVSSPQALGLHRSPLLGPADAGAARLFFEALHRDDPDHAEALLTGRFISGATIAQIGDRMIRPALSQIGELWEHEPAGVLYEHRAIDICVRAVVQLEGWLPALRADAPTAITAAGPADQHILPPLLSSLTLRERDVHARNLGPQTPVETIALAVERYRPAACVLSFTTPPADDEAWAPLLDTIRSTGTLLITRGHAAGVLPPRMTQSSLRIATLCELDTWATGLAPTRAWASPTSDDKDPS